jgi:DNA-binding transcriptional MerR regulator
VPTSLAIGDFSRATHLSVKTLRHYHRLGLLIPAEVDPDSSYRRYSTEQIPTAQVIRRFRDVDMPLDQIGAVLQAPDIDTRNALLTEHLARLQEGLIQTQEAVASLRRLLQGPSPALPMEHRSEPALQTAAISESVSLDDLVPWFQGALAELTATLAAQGVTTTGPPGGVIANDFFATERGAITIFVPSAATINPIGRSSPARCPPSNWRRLCMPGPTPMSTAPMGRWRHTCRTARLASRAQSGSAIWSGGSTPPTRIPGAPRSAGPSSTPVRRLEPRPDPDASGSAGHPLHPAGDDRRDLGLALAQGVITVDEVARHGSWYDSGLALEFVRGGEGVAPTRDEETRQVQRRKVLGTQPFGPPRGMQGITHQDQSGHA